MNANRILVVAGGSGGHVFPAIALVEHIRLQHPDWRIAFGTDLRCEDMVKSNLGAADIEILLVPNIRIDQRHRTVLTPFRLLRACLLAIHLILKIRPTFVIGFGGYACVPMLVAARLLRVDRICHEQNAVIGRANRFLKKIGIPITTTFKPKNSKDIWVGYPMRSRLRLLDQKTARTELRLNIAGRVLLLMGGSQGSERINLVATELCSRLPDWSIVHLTGVERKSGLIQHSNYRAIAFSNDMSQLYSSADFVISRAGSGALHEIVGYQKPAIIIPYPHAHGHQKMNAQAVLEGMDDDLIQIMEEAEVTVDSIVETMQKITSKPSIIGKNFFNFQNSNMRSDGTMCLLKRIEGNLDRG